MTAIFPPSENKDLRVCVSSILDLNLSSRQCNYGLFNGYRKAALKCLPQSERFNVNSLFVQGLTVLTHICHE